MSTPAPLIGALGVTKRECDMTYIAIFSSSYLLSFVFVFLWARAGNLRAADRLHQLGASEEQIANFHKTAGPPSLLTRPTLFFGTILGAITSLVFWGLVA